MDYNKKDIQNQFDVLKLYDTTIKRVWDAYQYGDIGSYQEALRYMIILLVEEKQDLSRRLLTEIHMRRWVDQPKYQVTNAVSDKRI